MTLCDDGQLDDFDEVMAYASCVLSAPYCRGPVHDVAGCDPSNIQGAAGAECLDYCRTVHGCGAENGAALFGCIEQCAEGLTGVDGHRFAA
ncbi:MAG: hypothetical protein VX568_08940, partial [Actinomycetota bacterium]|nr:hypothetical protein [Actinomycetota bacterium]